MLNKSKKVIKSPQTLDTLNVVSVNKNIIQRIAAENKLLKKLRYFTGIIHSQAQRKLTENSELLKMELNSLIRNKKFLDDSNEVDFQVSQGNDFTSINPLVKEAYEANSAVSINPSNKKHVELFSILENARSNGIVLGLGVVNSIQKELLS